jgi:hypothetical protein
MTRAPLLWPSIATPTDEVDAIKDLNATLVGIERSVEAWEASLILYKTAKQPPPLISKSTASRWRFIAVNECILELYHLRARLSKIRSVKLRTCPSLREHIDIEMMKAAKKRLDEYFPDIEALRHATAHKGENEAHPEVHAPGSKYSLSGFRQADRFSTPFQGQLRYIDITDQSFQRINSVVAEFFGAFVTAATALEKQGHLD